LGIVSFSFVSFCIVLYRFVLSIGRKPKPKQFRFDSDASAEKSSSSVPTFSNRPKTSYWDDDDDWKKVNNVERASIEIFFSTRQFNARL